jgi:hypothetical protein
VGQVVYQVGLDGGDDGVDDPEGFIAGDKTFGLLLVKVVDEG